MLILFSSVSCRCVIVRYSQSAKDSPCATLLWSIHGLLDDKMNSEHSHRASFSRLSLDYQRPKVSDHAYDSLLELLQSTNPELQSLSSSSPLIQGYLTRLTSSSLSSILEEHSTLDEEKRDLDHQLSRLAKREYHSFVSTASHGDAIASAFQGFNHKVASVHEKIQPLDQSIAQFNAFAKSQAAEREKAENLLGNHDKLLDILEMPSLVSTCVRNGYFSEAIQLSTHIKRLATLHYAKVPLVQKIAAQVETVMKEMTSRLLGLLREPLKLPSALKVVPLTNCLITDHRLSSYYHVSE
jgi:hypothetical protein